MQKRNVSKISLNYDRNDRIPALEGAGIHFSDLGAFPHVQKQHVSGLECWLKGGNELQKALET